MSYVMTEAEVYKLISVVAQELWGAQITTIDAICYGGMEECRKAGEEERSCDRMWAAFPERVTEAYVQGERKKAADKLRGMMTKWTCFWLGWIAYGVADMLSRMTPQTALSHLQSWWNLL